MDLVRSSSHLLGWYVCDDCDNANTFPLDGMAAVYTAIKQHDPFHVLLGAPWGGTWSVSSWSENGGGRLSLDVPQIENYVEQPVYLTPDDARNRWNMHLEPMINSPPMYLLASTWQKKPWPAVLEATLAWTAVINYGAVSQLNFIFESVFLNGQAALDPKEQARLVGAQWEHVAAQAEFSRTAHQLRDVLLPDITSSNPNLDLRLVDGQPCIVNGSSWLPANAGHASRQAGSVAMRGFRVPHSDWCAYVIVVNLCADPTSYTLELPVDLPERVKTAQHIFRAVRNVTLAGRMLKDELEGYSTGVMRLGCELVTESTSF